VISRVVGFSAFVAATLVVAEFSNSAAADTRDPCAARADVYWIAAPRADEDELNRWCRGVGPPLYLPAPSPSSDAAPPRLEDVVIVTWNAHLAAGRLDALVERFRGSHFVLLAQELFRRHPLPAFASDVRAARAIAVRDDEALDAADYAAALGVSMLYVPAVRNGAVAAEDRGNAIISSEPLVQPIAFELPFERQRRVAIGAAIDVMHDGKRSTLRVFDVHLENLSAPRSLWVFRNPRTRQMDALLDLLSASRFEDDVSWVGTIVGGDFNTVQGGEHEATYQRARDWGISLAVEDHRATHFMGRLDYLLFRLVPGLEARTTRLDDKFGSDHNPVIGRFTKIRE
jgi:endonuclease/exonuclease/phosphatase family metal-dependent hydrolase